MNETLKPSYWVSPPPERCDICSSPINKLFYDAKIPRGSWAIMCRRCFRNFRCSLGIGAGQKYEPTGDGRWQKTGG